MRCEYCKFEYEIFNGKTETEHLLDCSVYQNLPVVEVRKDGKRFIQHPIYPNLFIEKVSRAN